MQLVTSAEVLIKSIAAALSEQTVSSLCLRPPFVGLFVIRGVGVENRIRCRLFGPSSVKSVYRFTINGLG